MLIDLERFIVACGSIAARPGPSVTCWAHHQAQRRAGRRERITTSTTYLTQH